IAFCKIAHTFADGGDHPGRFHADGGASKAILDRFIREHAKAVHHVAEIEPGRLDADLDLAATRRPARHRLPLQASQTSTWCNQTLCPPIMLGSWKRGCGGPQAQCKAAIAAAH